MRVIKMNITLFFWQEKHIKSNEPVQVSATQYLQKNRMKYAVSHEIITFYDAILVKISYQNILRNIDD